VKRQQGRQSSGAGFGLYFIDILACMLFCLTLALVGARFGTETTVPIDLPELATAQGGAPGDLIAAQLAVREEDTGAALYFDDERVSSGELADRLAAASFERVVLRLEPSLLTEVIAAVREAGVAQIDLAYQVEAQERGKGRTQ